MGDALSMDTLPFQNEELAQINENQNEVISELTEHMIMLSNRVDHFKLKQFHEGIDRRTRRRTRETGRKE